MTHNALGAKKAFARGFISNDTLSEKVEQSVEIGRELADCLGELTKNEEVIDALNQKVIEDTKILVEKSRANFIELEAMILEEEEIKKIAIGMNDNNNKIFSGIKLLALAVVAFCLTVLALLAAYSITNVLFGEISKVLSLAIGVLIVSLIYFLIELNQSSKESSKIRRLRENQGNLYKRIEGETRSIIQKAH